MDEESTLVGDLVSRLRQQQEPRRMESGLLSTEEKHTAGFNLGELFVTSVTRRDTGTHFRASSPYESKLDSGKKILVKLIEIDPKEGQPPAKVTLTLDDLTTKLREENSAWSIFASEKLR